MRIYIRGHHDFFYSQEYVGLEASLGFLERERNFFIMLLIS